MGGGLVGCSSKTTRSIEQGALSDSKQQCLSVWPHLAHDAAHLYKQRMWSQVLSYPGTTTPGGLLNEPPGVIAVIMQGCNAHPAFLMAAIIGASKPHCANVCTGLGASKPNTLMPICRRVVFTCVSMTEIKACVNVHSGLCFHSQTQEPTRPPACSNTYGKFSSSQS
ncbi:MAG: hypothetical protein FRX49_06675 [Trebouxia sp. A1-2]|nr:MAG: hypothetical protein FRX49_06675 [Trebouxia sp. A1-2]